MSVLGDWIMGKIIDYTFGNVVTAVEEGAEALYWFTYANPPPDGGETGHCTMAGAI